MNANGTGETNISNNTSNDVDPSWGACPNGTCVGQYAISQIGGSIVPGTTDIGNNCDDCSTTVALPFSYTLYDQTYTSIDLSSNGTASFTASVFAPFNNLCLPDPRLHRWVHHLPILGRSADGFRRWLRCLSRRNLRHLHVGFGHCAQPHIQHRVARRVRLRVRHCQLRAEVVRGTDSL